jgi:ubiquinone/menaquinone biosynthesis C-methylase UbiE
MALNMGVYSRYIFPRVMEYSVSTRQVRKLRRRLLAGVRGDVFEVGFGTGLNLPHYPKHVETITAVDPNPGMNRFAQRRIDASPIEVNTHVLSGESLPMDDASFDSIVCTFTMCSVRDAPRALRELHRILRPGGRFYFLEHGLSDDPKVQKWQRRLTPIEMIIGDGCRFDRDPAALLREGRFEIERVENDYLRGVPRFTGYLYKGVAVKA